MTNSTPASTPSHSHASDVLNVESSITAADELKSAGNDHFRQSRWDEALASYRSGLGCLPPRAKITEDGSPNEPEGREGEAAQSNASDPQQVASENLPSRPDSYPQSEQCAKLRAVLNGNIAACYVKLGDHKKAVEACTEALSDDPEYVKALQRRASSNVLIDSWSSLTAAQEDYTTLLKLLPADSSQARDARRILQSLKPRVEAAQKQETAEMMDKLKGFGNSILGKFGLSTDNFKFEPNGQGGYSVNFQG